MTNTLREFNLEEAVKGAPMIDEEGVEVSEYHRFETLKPNKNVFIIKGSAYAGNDKGHISKDSCLREKQIYMKSRIIERWQNVYDKNMYISRYFKCQRDAD